MHYSQPTHTITSKIHIMAYKHRIKLALEEVANSDAPNITAIARKHNLIPSTLNRRARGVTRSREDRTSEDKKLLTDAQEETLIKQLN
jgi:transposase-like protein